MTFRAGPDSIGILAEFILITSRSKAIGIEIKGPGLQYDTLFANIVHYADAGDTAFREAAENMEVLAEKMHELSKTDGTVLLP
ncbi:hypothetical protein N7485_001157 [Penicillium canescens]|nr:hypothetical protein N7485_001157 [Penicillium canescens]